jgi:hypothetical protein
MIGFNGITSILLWFQFRDGNGFFENHADEKMQQSGINEGPKYHKLNYYNAGKNYFPYLSLLETTHTK